MNLTFTQFEVYACAVVLGAFFGAYRGWRREVITVAIELATIIFLLLHGVETIASLSSGASTSLIPSASAHGLSGGGPTGPSGSTSSDTSPYSSFPSQVCTNPISLELVALMVFGVMTFLAYRLGWAWGGPPKNSNDRIIGFFVGAVNGAAIMFYLCHSVFKGETIVLLTPKAWQAGQYLPLVILGAFVALVLLLLVASQSRKSGGASGAAH